MADKDILKSITECARKLHKANKALDFHLQKANEAKAEIEKLETKELLGLMQEAEMETFTLKSGFKVEVKADTYANISKDRAPKAFKWLRDHKFGGMIKAVVNGSFAKGEEKQAKALVAAAKKMGIHLSMQESVHPQTLRAWAREQMEKGAPVDEALFGIHIVNKAVLIEDKKTTEK